MVRLVAGKGGFRLSIGVMKNNVKGLILHSRIVYLMVTLGKVILILIY